MLIFIFNISTIIPNTLIFIVRYMPKPGRENTFVYLYIDTLFDCAAKVMFYFTSCLVLLIGLNQMAVFSSRRLHKGLQKRYVNSYKTSARTMRSSNSSNSFDGILLRLFIYILFFIYYIIRHLSGKGSHNGNKTKQQRECTPQLRRATVRTASSTTE